MCNCYQLNCVFRSADSEPEKEGDIKGVDQEEAMRDLLESGSDSEEEGKGEKKASDEGPLIILTLETCVY